jgi:site-specific DNA-cytosine methylase
VKGLFLIGRMILKLLELFSGTQSISKVFRDKGWETFTIDNNPYFEDTTSWLVDIMKVNPQDILEKYGKPDVIWASPPCTYFSVAAIGKNWNKDNTPKNDNAKQAVEIVRKTLSIIEELEPKYFFIENPVGKLRKLEILSHIPNYTVAYCQYGDNRQKPTDIWTNHPNPKFKPKCKRGAPCHQPAPRGSQSGTQGLKDPILKAMIPEGLCKHIYNLCMEENK